MNASPRAAAGRAVRIPLARLPLAPLPRRPRARRAPRVSPAASREALLPASENLIREIAEINTAQAAEPPRRRRRPRSGVAKLEEKPSFYLSLSDLMSLLLVFFVLIFSLTRPGAPPADARPEAASAPAAASLGAAPRAQAFHDPMPAPEPVPRRIRLGLMAGSAQGQSDPGLAAEKK
jgi:chemotaxis protein MotB